jgi:hypothetical protein
MSFSQPNPEFSSNSSSVSPNPALLFGSVTSSIQFVNAGDQPVPYLGVLNPTQMTFSMHDLEPNFDTNGDVIVNGPSYFSYGATCSGSGCGGGSGIQVWTITAIQVAEIPANASATISWESKVLVESPQSEDGTQAGHGFNANIIPCAAANDGCDSDNSNASNSQDAYGYTSGILPIIVVDLYSRQNSDNDCTRNITWSTLTEINSSHFEIQLSRDGYDFEYGGKVMARGAGTEYRFTLNRNDYSRYFRLKMVDYDGTYSYSKVLSVRSNCEEESSILKIYPNPAVIDGDLQVEYFTQSDKATFQIVDLQGRLVGRQSFKTVKNDVNNLQIDLQGLEPGLYMVISPEGKANRFIVTR